MNNIYFPELKRYLTNYWNLKLKRNYADSFALNYEGDFFTIHCEEKTVFYNKSTKKILFLNEKIKQKLALKIKFKVKNNMLYGKTNSDNLYPIIHKDDNLMFGNYEKGLYVEFNKNIIYKPFSGSDIKEICMNFYCNFIEENDVSKIQEDILGIKKFLYDFCEFYDLKYNDTNLVIQSEKKEIEEIKDKNEIMLRSVSGDRFKYYILNNISKNKSNVKINKIEHQYLLHIKNICLDLKFLNNCSVFEYKTNNFYTDVLFVDTFLGHKYYT